MDIYICHRCEIEKKERSKTQHAFHMFCDFGKVCVFSSHFSSMYNNNNISLQVTAANI